MPAPKRLSPIETGDQVMTKESRISRLFALANGGEWWRRFATKEKVDKERKYARKWWGPTLLAVLLTKNEGLVVFFETNAKFSRRDDGRPK